MKDNILEKKLECANLFSFYYKLLTEKQAGILRLYFMEDLSLTEIASQFGSSKQAVSDCILKSTQKLFDFEEKLHLKEKFDDINNTILEITSTLDNPLIDENFKNKILSLLEFIKSKEEN